MHTLHYASWWFDQTNVLDFSIVSLHYRVADFISLGILVQPPEQVIHCSHGDKLLQTIDLNKRKTSLLMYDLVSTATIEHTQDLDVGVTK